MKRLTKFLRPYSKLLIIGPTFKLLEAILELLLPFFMSMAIDKGVTAGNRNYVLTMGGIMLLTAVIGVICALICQYSASLVSQGVGTDIRNALFEHISTLSNAELDKFGTSSLVNRITNDVNQVQLAVAMLIRLVIRAPFLCIGGLVMAFILDMQLSIIMLLALPIFILILFFTMKKTVPLYRKVQKKLDDISLILRENLNGVRVIRAFARMDYEKEKFSTANKDYSGNAVRVGKISALLNPLTNLVLNFAIGAIIWFGGVRVNSGNMSTGEVIAYIGYVGMILAALIVISNLVVIFTKAYACAGRIVEVFDTKTSIQSSNDEKQNIDIKKEKNSLDHNSLSKNFAVEFKNVAMSYKEAIIKSENLQSNYYSNLQNKINPDKTVNPDATSNPEMISNSDKSDHNDIEHISIQVKKGETIGIIGGTGSGKSTLVNLIPRFYDATTGSVLVDGRDVREYDLDTLRNKIGIVPQKAVLFTGSIADNIRWGKEDASIEEISKACEIAQASEFIKELPEGLDTKILRGGVNVSGGQRQRLTIARALVREPEILILDDSFNALDYATEAALRKALQEHTKTKVSPMTTFIITQRVSTIKNVDQIIVLNEGQIVGMGKHEDLYENCDVYREIYQSQQMQNA